MTVSVYDYTDYRKYLQDYYLDRKKSSKAFSYRWFAGKAGISSVGMYKDVVEGRMSLGKSFIHRFAGALGLNKRECEYFENLVFFSETKDRKQRKYFFDGMMACSDSKIARIEADRYEYYSRWYYSAVRALISYQRLRDTPEDHSVIARSLDPVIRKDQAGKACAILKKLNLADEDDSGFLRLTDALISTGKINDPAVNIMHIVNFQKTMISSSLEAFNRHPLTSVDLSTLTLSISEQTFMSLKKDLAGFRKKALGIAGQETGADRVYQLNIQLYPLSKIYAEERGGE